MATRVIQQAPAYHARPRLAEDPAVNDALIEAALEKVRFRRERMENQCRPGQRPERQLGEPTAEGQAHAIGVRKGNPAGEPKVMRSLISAPMTLSSARAQLLAQVFADIERGKDALRNHLTPIDKACEEPELSALERFVQGTVASEGRVAITNYSGGSRGSDSERIPITDITKREIAARHFVYTRLPPAFQVKADFFVALMCGHRVTTKVAQPGAKATADRPLTMIDLGKTVAKTKDERVAKGAYIATYRSLGQLLYDLYSQWETEQAHQKESGIRQARPSRENHAKR